MPLKMKDLIAQSQESKSTILYYLKEGLLPQPLKPKPNVHLYDDSCVPILKFIKYIQHNFSYTINEIKNIFQDNDFDFDGSFETMVHSIELISGARQNIWYSENAFLEATKLDSNSLKAYEDKGYLFQRAKGFSSKELEIADILENAKALGLDFELFDAYVDTAKSLAICENDMGANLLKNSQESHNKRYELLFDVILKLKPYIFNMHTVKNHQERLKVKKSQKKSQKNEI